MTALIVTRQPAFRLTVVASVAQAVTFQVVGKWRLVVVTPEALPPPTVGERGLWRGAGRGTMRGH